MNMDRKPEDIRLPPSPPLEGKEQLHLVTTSQEMDIRIQLQTPQESVSPLELSSPASLSTHTLPRVRTHSPSSRGHQRSQSAIVSSHAPPMQRAHSSPGVDAAGRLVLPLVTNGPRRPASPSSYTGRRRSPLRSTMEDLYPGVPTWSGLVIEPNIPEHAELDISNPTLPPLPTEGDTYSSSPASTVHNTFPRSRRKPTSSLHQSASAPSLKTASPSLASAFAGNSPTFGAQKYTNEAYPYYSFSSTSSVPSTPTSLRSRSPSISSLETIPDTPEEEEAARLEAEELTTLRNAAGLDDIEAKKRGLGLGAKKDRKRWSVCGAERRADFSLEPIEE